MAMNGVDCMYVHVPVANSLMNIGLLRGNSSRTTWAGPNMADINMLDMAPKCELKLVLMESSLPPALKKIIPLTRLTVQVK